MSGDDTLVLSGAEDVLSLNDTFVLSEDNNTFDDGNMSDDDLLEQVCDGNDPFEIDKKRL
jgi:hypothetical protein